MAWGVLHLRGFGSVSYQHVMLPWQWPEAVREQGEDLIFQGRLLALNGDSEDAIPLITQGVTQAHNQEGCLHLAGLLVARHDESDALALLVQGLDWDCPSRQYIQTLADQARLLDDTAILATALRELWRIGWGGTNPEDRAWLASEYGRILYDRGEWRRLLAWADSLPAECRHSSSLLRLEVSAQLALGQENAVLDTLQHQRMRGGANAGDILPLLAETYFRRGDADRANRVLQLALTLASGEPEAHLRLLQVTSLHPEFAPWRQRILDNFFQRFGRDEQSMARLAGLLNSLGAIADLIRLQEHARTEGFTESPFLFPLIDTLLADGQIESARKLLPEALGQNWPGTESARLHALQHLLAEYLTMDPFQPVLGRMRSLPVAAGLPEVLGVAAALNRNGRTYVARELLTLAQTRYSRSLRLQAAMQALETGQTSPRGKPSSLLTRS